MRFEAVDSYRTENSRMQYKSTITLRFRAETAVEKALLTALKSSRKTVYIYNDGDMDVIMESK